MSHCYIIHFNLYPNVKFTVVLFNLFRDLEKESIIEEIPDAVAFTRADNYYKDKELKIFIVFCRKYYTYEILCHEAYHAVAKIAKSNYIKDYSEEKQAIDAGYIVKKIYNRLYLKPKMS